MKSVRLFYKKKSRMKFVSHLDMNRFMTRMLRLTNIPVWYTEGFNRHVYVAFALPLTLGFESDSEIMDFKVTDDNYGFDNIVSELKRVMPPYIEIVKVSEPVKKVGDIGFAEFRITFDGNCRSELSAFLQRDEIICEKQNKKGKTVSFNLSEKIYKYEVSDGAETVLSVILPAGNNGNVNPIMIIDSYEKLTGTKLPYYMVNRVNVYDTEHNIFE